MSVEQNEEEIKFIGNRNVKIKIKRPERPKGLHDTDYKHLIKVAINHAIKQFYDLQPAGLQTTPAQIAKQALESVSRKKDSQLDTILRQAKNREKKLEKLLNPSSKKSSRSRRK